MIKRNDGSIISLICINQNTGVIKHINNNISVEEIKKINDSGFNIYEIVNEFQEARKIDNLVSLKALLFDIDNKDLSKEQLLNLSKEKFGIQPYKINETYKGFHLLYNLSEDLSKMGVSRYKALYNIMNIILGGDQNMRSVTGIFKKDGFFDKKIVNGKERNFFIKNIYLNSKNIIGKIDIEFIFNKFNYLFKIEQKKEYNPLINNTTHTKFEKGNILDILDYIDNNIKQVNYNYNLGNTINFPGFDGIKILVKDHNNFKISDFSNKDRYGLYGFLNNFILKDSNQDFKNKKIVELYNNFNLTLPKKLNNINNVNDINNVIDINTIKVNKFFFLQIIKNLKNEEILNGNININFLIKIFILIYNKYNSKNQEKNIFNLSFFQENLFINRKSGFRSQDNEKILKHLFFLFNINILNIDNDKKKRKVLNIKEIGKNKFYIFLNSKIVNNDYCYTIDKKILQENGYLLFLTLYFKYLKEYNFKKVSISSLSKKLPIIINANTIEKLQTKIKKFDINISKKGKYIFIS